MHADATDLRDPEEERCVPTASSAVVLSVLGTFGSFSKAHKNLFPPLLIQGLLRPLN